MSNTRAKQIKRDKIKSIMGYVGSFVVIVMFFNLYYSMFDILNKTEAAISQINMLTDNLDGWKSVEEGLQVIK